ncbi:MAG: c-type cytochrome biogenesis protein CcmI, partial [Bradyrhizobium sp.]|nr:c-type cytochrome biogenesis protein CcmI [Bradyrhizobium sp.]
MNLWFVFALMTAAAMFAVLLPLGLGGARNTGGNEAAVYKDQLAEIERDLAAGLIGGAEAEAARVEVGRRLLAVADQTSDPPAKPSPRLRRVAAMSALVGLPLLA